MSVVARVLLFDALAVKTQFTVISSWPILPIPVNPQLRSVSMYDASAPSAFPPTSLCAQLPLPGGFDLLPCDPRPGVPFLECALDLL